MRLIAMLALASLLMGCATRNKVFFNKQTSPRWVPVENAKEFMTEEELSFLKLK